MIGEHDDESSKRSKYLKLVSPALRASRGIIIREKETNLALHIDSAIAGKSDSEQQTDHAASGFVVDM